MKLETFFEKFDQFADAPDAVAKMRELVLHLAVTGKLVDQDPSDESGEQLLKKINAERLAAVKARQISPMKPLPAVGEDELLFELQPGWAAARLIELVMEIQTGPFGSSLHKSDYQLGGTPVINPASLKDGKIVPIDEMAIGHATLKRLEVFKLNAGDIVMARRGEMGRCAIVTENEAGWLCGTGSLVLRMPRSLFAPYLAMLIGAPMARTYLGGASVGTTMQNLNQSILAKMPVGVPPLAEQKRIVAKVDELMALCDRLEAQQQERETRHAALARASLARFADAPTPANLPFLFHPSYAIPPADLRKSILDLAVYGKLSAPAPDDDEIPSLEEFREAAASLANSLGLRSPKESLDEAEPPFDVPGHWRWMALADLGAAQTGTTPSKNDHEAFNGDIPFIKPADILPDGVNYSNESLTRYGAESGSRLAPAGSLLMVCIGTIGKCNLIERECAFNQQINSLSPVQWVDSQYLLLAVRAPYFQDAAWKKSSSTTIAILNKGKWLSIPVPIPPLAEQRRIVAKVEQLMALVDALETQLAASRATAANLLSAFVAELTAQG